MLTLGFDPGFHGAITTFDNLTVINVQDIPYIKYPTIGLIPDFKKIRKIVDGVNPDLVVFENIGASPSDGIASASKFTKGFGVLIGCCSGVDRVVFVTPRVWKCGTALVNKPKKAAIQKALDLHPEARVFMEGYKNINDRADSILLTHYYLRIKEKLKDD